MPVDYAALARQHGGSVVEEEDAADYSGLASMRPMVAHTPRSQTVDYAKLAGQHGGVAVEDEEPREAINYRGLRMVRQGSHVEVSPDPTDEEKSALLQQAALVVPTLGAPLMAPALATGVGVAANLAAGNVGGAVLDAAMGMIPGGRIAKMGGKALMARIAHKLGRAGRVAEALEPIAEKAASRSYSPGSAVPMFEVGEASNVVKMPIRLPAESASTVAEAAQAATPAAEAVVDRAATQTAKRAPRAVAKRAKATLAEDATESTLESRLRASTLTKQQLAQEIEAKVLSLKLGTGKGLSNAQLGKALHELYGVGETYGEQMADMVLKAHGVSK